MKEYYEILGLEIGSTKEEVDQRYNQLLEEFDPKGQSDDDLKEFFKSEQEKVKEAYKEITQRFLQENIQEDSTNKNEEEILFPLDEGSFSDDTGKETTTNEEDISDVSKIEKKHKYSISSETELKLTRAYLIMFILGFPLVFLIVGIFGGFSENILESYYDVLGVALLFHFIGAMLVLLYHMFLIKKSSGFLSIKKHLIDYFKERKKYFLRILIITPLVLVFLYGWGGYFTYYDIAQSTYYEDRYRELKIEISGDNYDSGCKKRKALKIHNQSAQDLKISISYKNKYGVWSPWETWTFDAGRYSGISSYKEAYNGGTIYTTDYRYYIRTTSYNSYLYSRELPHITNTCNAKCINIY